MGESRSRDFALEVVKRLRAAGFQALWAGGCVRDLLLGETPADYDVATSALPDQALAILPFHAIPVGASFGVVRVLDPTREGQAVEIATFRGDGEYKDARRPSKVEFGTAEIDAARRDFTINGMFLDPIENHVIDYVGGREDLKNRVLRAIGDPYARFREDHLRVLRAVRMAARFELEIEPVTRRAIKAGARGLLSVSAERIAQELRRMLVHPSRAFACDLALEVGLLRNILPPLVELRGVFAGLPAMPEADFWDHTLRVLELLPCEPSFPLAFAALMHDVEKPRLRFHQYDSARQALERLRITDSLCRRLKLSNAERDQVGWLVKHHERLRGAGGVSHSMLKRLLAAPATSDLLELERADALASFGEAPHVDYCESYLRHEPYGPINPPPLLTGHDLMTIGLTPGPQFARILEMVRDEQLDLRLASRDEALQWVASHADRTLPSPSPET